MIHGRPIHVFHPTDFSIGDEAAFCHAVSIVSHAEGRLSLLHIKQPDSSVDWSDFPSVRSTLMRWRRIPENSSVEQLDALGVRVYKAIKSSRHVAKAVTAYLEDHRPDLLVLSTHRRCGVERFTHPSLSEAMARHVSTPTLFVPRDVAGFVHVGDGRLDLRSVLVPIDRDPHPRVAIHETLELLRILSPLRLRLVFLHVGRSADMPSMVEHDLPAGWTREVRVRLGPVVETLLATAQEIHADLIAMGTRLHHGMGAPFFGSTTEQVLHGTACPLLSVRKA
jgi:nucleotide-binding universal stress UspA family protein